MKGLAEQAQMSGAELTADVHDALYIIEML